MAKKETLKEIKNLVEDLLAKIDQTGEITVKDDQKNEAIKVKIKTEDPGVLIGFHAKTLSAIQLILGLMIYRRTGQWQRLVVDVNDYRQEQMERLKGIAQTAAQKAKFSGQSVILSPMTPFERRIIHLAISEFEGVETRSEGELDGRHVVIFPTKASK